jgi:hypothetical protein
MTTVGTRYIRPSAEECKAFATELSALCAKHRIALRYNSPLHLAVAKVGVEALDAIPTGFTVDDRHPWFLTRKG